MENEQKSTNWWLPILIIVILAGIIIGWSYYQKSKQPKEDIKVGVISPLTGTATLYGQGSLDMINMAVEEINNNGGIKGRKLVVLAEDGKCQSEPAVTAAKKLIETDGVKLILGGHCSSETVAIAPVLDQNQVFGLAGVSTSTGILDKYTYMFRTSPPNLEQAKLIASLAYNKYNIKNIAMLVEQTTFAKSIAGDFVTAFKELGGNIVDEEAYASDQKDFKTELTKIKAKSPDAIFVSPQGQPTGAEIVKEIKTMGINAKLTGNTVFVGKKIYTDSQGSLPNGTFTVAPYADPSNSKTAELIEKYKAKYGKDIPYNNFFVGAAYDGVYMLKDALLKCGVDATCVRDYFHAIKNWSGSVATFSFKPNGDPEINNWSELRIEDGNEIFEKVQ